MSAAARITPVLRRCAFALGYLAVAYLLLRPILQTDVIDDDFANPFGQAMDVGTGLGHALSLGWHQSWVAGDRTRTVGVVVGDFSNWLWLWVTSTFDVSIQHYYAVLRLVVISAAALSAASFWWIAARTYFRPVRWTTAVVLSSVALFGTLQLHGLWSNDPVESYTLAGYGSTAVGFGLLTVSVWATRRPSVGRFGLATLAALLAVSYYEFNAGAVVGAGVILAAAGWPLRRERRALLRYGAGVAAFCLVPAVWLLVTRQTAAKSTYAGRILQGSGALDHLGVGLISSLPGAAWSLADGIVGGSPPITALAVVAAAVAVVAVLAWLGWDRRGRAPRATAGADRLAAAPAGPPPADRPPVAANRLAAAGAIVAVVIYAIFAAALEGATAGGQAQQTSVGYVYTDYAVGSTAFALLLGLALWWLSARRGPRWRAVWVGVALISGAYMAMQVSLNDKIKYVVNADFARNQTFDEAFAARIPESDRCAAVVSWATLPYWPDYYRAQVVNGSQVAYRQLYGQPMCRSWVGLTDGFQDVWLTQPTGGSLEIANTACATSCRGTLRLRLASFHVPRRVSLTLDGTVVARNLRVPTRPKTFAIPLHLNHTFNQVFFSASGPALSQAAVRAGPGTSPYYVLVGLLQFNRA